MMTAEVTMEAVFNLLTNINERVTSFEKRLSDHMDEEEEERKRLIEELASLRGAYGEVKTVLVAFPQDADGKPDLHGHRAYHVQIMDSEKRSAQFWEQRKGAIADKLLTVLLFVIALGVVEWVRGGFKGIV